MEAILLGQAGLPVQSRVALGKLREDDPAQTPPLSMAVPVA